MPQSYTALHQSAPTHTAHPKWARWTRDPDEQDRRGPAAPRKHYVGLETQHAVELNALSASDEHYYAPDVPTNEL